MKELFQQIWQLLQGENRNKADSPEVRDVLKRMARVTQVREPDYKQMWKEVRRATIGKRERHIKFFQGVAAVLLPVLILSSAVYFYHSKYTSQPKVAKVEKEIEDASAVRLTLADGKVIRVHKDSVVNLVVHEDVAIRHKSNSALSYEVKGPVSAQLEYNTLEMPVGGSYQLTLSDGSVVYLNSCSKLKYPVAFVGNERRVFLEGEGYFEVKSDKNHPFRVVVANVEVEAVGTCFNINAYPEKKGVETTLVKGKVNVEDGNQKVGLLPGQQACCSEQKISVKEVNYRDFIGWKNGKFVFRKMSLENIMIQMERWYGLSVFFRNREAQAYTFTGMIDRNLSPEETFRTIEKTVDVRFRLNGKTVIVE